ncbi:MAG: hypothetical protein JO225_14175 [Candidatus Eremiobacteraeota bacterium]|nr:hypothetical protein [Candidatus Eremiobacteraeota bacterium]MBV8645050.1 hypothetical protein [Candidatus Eremiobacteraeota bacterium]
MLNALLAAALTLGVVFGAATTGVASTATLSAGGPPGSPQAFTLSSGGPPG